MPNSRKCCKTVVINSNLFVLGLYYENSKNNDTLIGNCNKTKTLSSKAQLRLDYNYFCFYSFKKDFYVIHETVQCFVYNPKSDNWFKLADTREKRVFAACTALKD